MDKDMLMGELHIYEFGCRNILYLILESFSMSEKISKNGILF